MVILVDDRPKNADEETWNAEDGRSKNLFFSEYGSDESGSVGSAILRLYRSSENNTKGNDLTTPGGGSSCDGHSPNESGKSVRVSIYYYRKPLKKHKRKYQHENLCLALDFLQWALGMVLLCFQRRLVVFVTARW